MQYLLVVKQLFESNKSHVYQYSCFYSSADNKEAGVFNDFHRPMLSSGYGDGWGAWRILVHEVDVMCSCVPNV